MYVCVYNNNIYNNNIMRETIKMKKSKHMAKMVADSSTSIEHTSTDIDMKEYACGVMRVYTHNSGILGMKMQ